MQNKEADPSKSSTQTDDKDQQLRDDIRQLGRMLGDTVRNQHGDEIFNLIETVRQNAIRFGREQDLASKQNLEQLLDSLSNDRMNKLIRAFSYFSHLANIAEDQHHIRRTRAHLLAGSAPRPSSIA